MQSVGSVLQLSATDVASHLMCPHQTRLNRAVVEGALKHPHIWDPMLEVLWQRGARHELGYIEALSTAGHQVTEISGIAIADESVDATNVAMQRGDEVIVQGVLRHGYWVGRVDVLKRVPGATKLGDWGYEPIDTKLSRETKGGTVLQLCLYAQLIAEVQGRLPEYMHVVPPSSDYVPQSYRTVDFTAYFRRVQRSLVDAAHGTTEMETYPEPNDHCDVCRWRVECERRRRSDDHLSLVAGISSLQRTQLVGRGVTTVAGLAEMPLPLQWKPERGAVSTYERVREQARVQVEGRLQGKPVFELLPVVPDVGLSALPEPSVGDVFLDLEGDPFVGAAGLEYLFGYCFLDAAGELLYRSTWALSRDEEKIAFEQFIDFVVDRWTEHPSMHIYHFAPYEPSALKRLMGRYATREAELDRLLRSARFVDLYGIVRHAVRASVESYSIKRLEPLYGFNRVTNLPDANVALAVLQGALELDDPESITNELRVVVESYNKDDCRSTQALREWLEQLRNRCIDAGTQITRPVHEDGAPSESLDEWQSTIDALVSALTADIPIDAGERSAEQQGCWVLAYLLDWHRREDKAAWWEYFRLRDLLPEDLLDERAAIAGLQFVDTIGGTSAAPVHRYSFPAQEADLRGGESLYAAGGAKFGAVETISAQERSLNIKKRRDSAVVHPAAVFAHDLVNSKVIAQALVRIGGYVAEHGMEGEGPFRAARALLLRERPRIGDEPFSTEGEDLLDAACRAVVHLDSSVLPIQGPPGSGKTYTAGRMICRLVEANYKVGITANSHNVIRKLLDEVLNAAAELSVDVYCCQKTDRYSDESERLRFTNDNGTLFALLQGECQVAGGTAWLWSREDAHECVDYLFVDEAGQMSLANVIAVSQAARNLVLLGDPQQLEQPIQGTHPDGTAVSALEHVLQQEQTMGPEQGLFIEHTWRLHPDICSFTSELFYAGRLHPVTGLEHQRVESNGPINGVGLRYVPVQHVGNTNASPQEVAVVETLLAGLLDGATTWTDRLQQSHPVTSDDILVIAPYNAQVFELQARLPGIRVGTVDKFQGQEAPVVIYSLTTSSREDAPRGMEFLYSLNRLNVATSRARCVAVLVASPRLFEAGCRTPDQIRLANALCRYLELADVVNI